MCIPRISIIIACDVYKLCFPCSCSIGSVSLVSESVHPLVRKEQVTRSPCHISISDPLVKMRGLCWVEEAGWWRGGGVGKSGSRD